MKLNDRVYTHPSIPTMKTASFPLAIPIFNPYFNIRALKMVSCLLQQAILYYATFIHKPPVIVFIEDLGEGERREKRKDGKENESRDKHADHFLLFLSCRHHFLFAV